MTITKRQYQQTKSNDFEQSFKDNIAGLTDWLYEDDALKTPGPYRTKLFNALVSENNYWPLDFPLSDVLEVFVTMFKTTKVYTGNHRKLEYVVEAFNRTVKFNATAFSEAIAEKRKEFYQ